MIKDVIDKIKAKISGAFIGIRQRGAGKKTRRTSKYE